MARKKSNMTDIQVYQKKRRFSNIGIILFGVVFVYLVIIVLTYLANSHVSAYEVREGSIQTDTAYTGIIVRQEEVVNAAKSGYINYFVTEGSKVGSKTNVYCISSEKLNFNAPSSENKSETELTSEEQSAIIQRSSAFLDTFKTGQFSDIYTFKDSINDIIQNNTTQSRQAILGEMADDKTLGLDIFTAQNDGIIVYSMDGYENLTIDSVTPDMLEKRNYLVQETMNNTMVEPETPVYKLITDNSWTLVIRMDDNLAEALANENYVKIRFLKDNEITWANFYEKKYGNVTLGFLNMKQSMVRYATDRFLDIELILDDQSGLKIPKSSVTTKEFYPIPQDYFTHGGNSNSLGVMVQQKENTAQFQTVSINYRDKTTNEMYVDAGVFKKGTVLIKPDSAETFTLTESKPLTGVYNINKGFSVFRYVDILTENDEYYIVATGSDYGLSNYDRIVLDAAQVRDNEIVF